MTSIKKYKYLLLSFIFTLLAILSFCLPYIGYFQESLYVLYFIPIFLILAIFFALRSLKLHESSYVAATVVAIGIVALIFVLLWGLGTLMFTSCGPYGCYGL